jgi:hypothetical protein
LDVSKLRPIFGEPTDARFLALFSKSIFDLIELKGQSDYAEVRAFPANANEIPGVIATLDGPHHIFCITSDSPFTSPLPDQLADSKLGVLPLFSTGFSVPKLEKALEIIFQLDYGSQYARSKELLSYLTEFDKITFEFGKHQTTLDLSSSGSQTYFFNQSGSIESGRQSVLPNGEVSLLTDGHGRYSSQSRFAMDGEIVLHGYPILHRGHCPCRTICAQTLCEAKQPNEMNYQAERRYVSTETQERIFWDLEAMAKYACLARVKDGVIESMRTFNGSNSFVKRLNRMFESDENYRKIHEIGFGLNPCKGFFYGGNFLPNEMRFGVHFGLGLTPYTEFHLDLACLPVSVFVRSGMERVTVMDAQVN